MGIRAEVSIGAFIHTVRIVKAEIFLVFLIAIVLLHKRVCIKAILSVRALLILLYIVAHFSCVEVAIAPSILS